MVSTRSQTAREITVGVKEIDRACATTTIVNVSANLQLPFQADTGPSTLDFEDDAIMVEPDSTIFDSDDAMSDFDDDENATEMTTASDPLSQARSLIVKLKISLPQDSGSANTSSTTEAEVTGSDSSAPATRLTRGTKRELPLRSMFGTLHLQT